MSLTLLGNRYQVLQTLGAGGFGTTFLAEDTQMPSHRKCVIKQLKPIANNPEIYQLVQERFQREAAILEDLGDANGQIPRLFAYFSEEGQFYLIQEWVEGDTLREVLQSEGAVSEAKVKQMLIDILPVLSYVHSKHIIHRDIKPDNIILRKRDGKPVLIDFGAVRESMGTVVNSKGETGSSIVIGTPGFMPSEQAAGRPVYSSDLYSLGLTMICLLTAKEPQNLDSDPTTGEIIWRRFAPQVSPEFAAILDRAIGYHPRDRFPTAAEMLSALQGAPRDWVNQTLAPTSAFSQVPPTITDAIAPPFQQPTQVPATVVTPPSTLHQVSEAPAAVTEQQSHALPDEVLGWNWGAFLLPGFWCLNNQIWLGLLAWTGVFTGSIGWWIAGGILGAKGNEWAWKSRRWRSVEAFKKNQRNWAIAGLGTWGSLIGLVIAIVILVPPEEEFTNNSNSGNPNSGNVTSAPPNPSGSTMTTNIFGTTEPLTEPGTNINGTWRLRYTVETVVHEGTLMMQGTQGTLTTRLTDNASGATETVQQTMRLWSSPRGLVLLGYNPIDMSTKAAHDGYAADNFLFQQQADGSLKVTNCDDMGVCTDVAAEFVRN